MRWVLKKFGLRFAYFIISFAIPYFYLFAPKARRSLNQYWKNVRPDLKYFLRQAIIFRHFYRFAQVLIDRAYQENKTEAQFQYLSKGIETLVQAVEAKKGLVAVNAHVGAWDMAFFVLRKKQTSTNFKIVKFEAEGLTYDKVVGKTEDEQRRYLTHQGSQSEAGSLIFKLREILQKGEPVGLMGDRPMSHQIELVKFMGKLAIWDLTPMKLAKLCKVPMISTFAFKGKNKDYEFYASPPIEVTDPYEAATQYCTHLETLMKQYPDQWFNFFPFWSRNETF